MFCAKISFEFFVYCIILQSVTTGKDSILFIRMTIKRTFQNHNGLIFNDLYNLIDGGGGKNAQSIMWCKRSNRRKKKFQNELKKFPQIRVYSLLYIYSYLYYIVIFIYSIYYF